MIKHVKRKSMIVRYSGRSSDYISPSFGFGCLYKCHYCYLRRKLPKGLTIANNPEEILDVINRYTLFDAQIDDRIVKPNQTDDKYITWDLSCNEDFALHHKYHNWERIFTFFRDHSSAKATLATKYIPTAFLDFNPQKKVRIRFSLSPQNISSILEPNTTKIIDRIKAVNDFIKAGYDVHLNFSPVVVTKTWTQDYIKLFKLVDNLIEDEYKSQVKCEVIFLTHNKDMHLSNLNKSFTDAETLLWTPNIQENKTSQYGGKNIRYKRNLKNKYIENFKIIHNKYISWCKIRYIF